VDGNYSIGFKWHTWWIKQAKWTSIINDEIGWLYSWQTVI